MGILFRIRRATPALGFRLGGWPRRIAVVACLLLAALSALSAHRSAPAAAPATVAVVTAARDLPAGRVLAAVDVRVVSWPAAIAPRAAEHSDEEVLGLALGAAMARGEPVTATRLRGRGLTTGLAVGTVAMTVEIDDAAALSLARAGDLVDVLAGGSADGVAPARARVVASSVRVLAVVAPSAAAGRDGGSVVVAADRRTALNLATAIGTPMTVTVHAP